MTRTTLRSMACAAAGGVLAVTALVSADAQRGPQQTDIIVVDRDDNPVTTLTVRDIVVREDGVAREVATVAHAGPPSPVVLLVDTSQAVEPAVSQLRTGLTSLVTSLNGSKQPVQIGLRTFGDRPTKVADPTTTGTAVRGAIERLFHQPGTGAHMLDTIVETCTDLVKTGAVRPAIVAFVAEAGPEFSHNDRPRVAQALQRAGATLWVVVLQASAGGILTTDENRQRAAVVGDVTTESGGLHVQVLSPQGIPAAFERLARLLTSRVRVSYARPEALIPPKALEVTLRREDVRVLAPRWAGR
jgi:hypothetical protein